LKVYDMNNFQLANAYVPLIKISID